MWNLAILPTFALLYNTVLFVHLLVMLTSWISVQASQFKVDILQMSGAVKYLAMLLRGYI